MVKHSHSDEHSFGTNPVSDNSFRAGIILNVAFVIAEAVSGLLSNSMALLSDSGHNFSDVVTLIFAWGAINLRIAPFNNPCCHSEYPVAASCCRDHFMGGNWQARETGGSKFA
jgi:Co/Zn/Cd efflux system component